MARARDSNAVEQARPVLRVVAIIAGTVFAGEFVLAALTGRMPPMLDTIALTTLTLLGAWLAVLRPLSLRNREQQRALTRVIAALQRFRFAFTSVDESVVISDREGVILDVNPSFTRLFGYSADEVRGLKTSVLRSGQQDAEFYAGLWRSLAAGETWQGRIVNRTRSGELIELAMAISPLRDERLNLLGYVAVHRDLRQSDEQERLLREALERQRRAAAEMEVLKVSAEAASEAKSRFLATMSHEIRTPLAGVLGTLEVLAGQPLAPGQQYFADLALRSSRALQAVLNDVLDFSRIEAGQVVLEAAPVDVCALAHEVRELFLAQTQQKGLRLEVRCEASELWVKGDAVQLRQVLSNLVGNAVKFTHVGSVVLRLEAQVSAGEVALCCCVEDTGVGIAPQHRAALFNPFTQADASFKRRFGGSGLGLAISRRLAEAMGGTLEAQSDEGIGSVFTFKVTLPRSARVACPESEALSEDERALVRGLRVLVAEDNPINQVVASRLLQRLGCEVALAENGAAALELLGKRGFDLVLMDCQMPVLDGLEATREIRASPEPWRAVPVVALTANAFIEDRTACFCAGMNGFVTKPVHEVGLVRAMLAVLRPQAPQRLAG
ncbi:MAG: ATP-binding protein [Archangium sp.]|nr:ATP-binding protein [Archangium sp.]